MNTVQLVFAWIATVLTGALTVAVLVMMAWCVWCCIMLLLEFDDWVEDCNNEKKNERKFFKPKKKGQFK